MTSGWRTSEFWLSFLAVLVSSMLASGVLDGINRLEQLLGALMAMLTALGYTGARVRLKRAAR